MGKGDKKSFRGKGWRSSYGNTRPHKKRIAGKNKK
jgi:ribosomal small subunit protein bTHX